MNFASSIPLLLCFLFSTDAEITYESRTNSLLPPYINNKWTFYGSAMVDEGRVSLTRDEKSQQGGVYNLVPLMFRDWEIHITFHVHSAKTLVGDGFAVWLTQSYLEPGSAFGSRDVFRGLGVFFDTYANQIGKHGHDHPYISVMVNDGSDKYDHDKDGTLTELAGCSSDFRDKDYATAIIRYASNRLEVSLRYRNSKDMVPCLAVDDVHLPTGYFIGLSAATGELSDNHEVYAVHTYALDIDRIGEDDTDLSKITPSVGQAIRKRDRVPDDPPASRTSRIFFKGLYWLFILSVVLGGGLFGFLYYKKRQRQMKRLY